MTQENNKKGTINDARSHIPINTFLQLLYPFLFGLFPSTFSHTSTPFAFTKLPIPLSLDYFTTLSRISLLDFAAQSPDSLPPFRHTGINQEADW